MATKPRVFALQKQKRYDISAVKYYSKDIIYVVNDEHINPFDTYALVDLIEHKLFAEAFNPDHDFICLTGSSILLALFLATIVRHYAYQEQFKILMFDAKRNNYKLRLLNFGE